MPLHEQYHGRRDEATRIKKDEVDTAFCQGHEEKLTRAPSSIAASSTTMQEPGEVAPGFDAARGAHDLP
jgi:hypothetical protein